MICWIQKLSWVPKYHSSLSALFLQGSMHFCSLTSALMYTPAISIIAVTLGCQSHYTWLEGLELLSLHSQISRDWVHSTQHFWIWFWLYISHRLPERKSCLIKSPCLLALSTYLYFAFSQLRHSSHLWGDRRDPRASQEQQAAQLLAESFIYWKFHNFVFPSKTP